MEDADRLKLPKYVEPEVEEDHHHTSKSRGLKGIIRRKKHHEEEENTGTKVEGFLPEFFELVENVRSNIQKMNHHVHQMELYMQNSIVGVSKSEEEAHTQRFQQSVESLNLLAVETKLLLKSIVEENHKVSEKTDYEDAELRIRINVQTNLTKKFLEVIKHSEEIQVNIKNKRRIILERQIDIIAPAAKDRLIEEMTNGDGTLEIQELLQRQILGDQTKHQQAADALSYIQAKHEQIVHLEQSILELHQLFLDLSILVDAQGELIEEISWNVEQSVRYTEGAVKEMRKALHYQKKSRKKFFLHLI